MTHYTKKAILYTYKAIFISIFMLIGTQAHGQNKRALIIGLGEYKDKTWGKIHGDSDVPIIKDMLLSCGYTSINTIVNDDATKGGIVAEFEALANRCKMGDTVYIHFSGHGQQITDINGDEDDGWDEAWIPYDAMFSYSQSYKGEKHLIDDEIANLITAIKVKIGESGKILLVVDACHSGDSTRGHDNDEQCIRGTSDRFVIPMNTKPALSAKSKENWITLTACKDYQTNCEFRSEDGGFYGILSYSLCSFYKQCRFLDNNDTVAQLQGFVNDKRLRGRQTLTLTGETANHSLTQFFK